MLAPFKVSLTPSWLRSQDIIEKVEIKFKCGTAQLSLVSYVCLHA